MMNKKTQIKIVLFTVVLSLIILSLIYYNFNNKKEIVIAKGDNLKEFRLSLDLNLNKKFEDPNNPNYEPGFSVHHLSEDYFLLTVDPPYANSINGYMTIICIDFSDSEIDMNLFPIAYLQAFNKSDSNKSIKIGKKSYKMNELNTNKIYENDNTIVYDITNLLDFLNVDSKIEQISKTGYSRYNYEWLKDMYNYYVENTDEILKIQEKQ